MPNELVYFFIFSSVVIALIFKLKNKASKHLNSDGYFVLADSKELEHRFIAKQLLGRNLNKNEVVHHINGRKTDNQINNLCLMDRQRHEFFHTWLRWKREKSGKYPSIKHQKNILKNEYNGILLEHLPPIESKNGKKTQDTQIPTKNTTQQQKKLFNLLREERYQLAARRKIPVYIICNNQTLIEISQKLPTTGSELLLIKGFGSEKVRLYGADFIRVVTDFNKLLIQKNNKTSA